MLISVGVPPSLPPPPSPNNLRVLINSCPPKTILRIWDLFISFIHFLFIRDLFISFILQFFQIWKFLGPNFLINRTPKTICKNWIIWAKLVVVGAWQLQLRELVWEIWDSPGTNFLLIRTIKSIAGFWIILPKLFINQNHRTNRDPTLQNNRTTYCNSLDVDLLASIL